VVKDKNACGLKLKYFCIFAAFLNTTMSGKDICKYLKSVRRAVAEANGIELDISECSFEGRCPGTCPKCEAEVRSLESALSARRRMARKVALLGVAAGLSFGAVTSVSAQSEIANDSLVALPPDSTDEWTLPDLVGEIPLEFYNDFDVPPQFVGGTDSLIRYLAENYTLPNMGERVYKGTILVEFVIEASGKVSNPKVILGLDPLLDAEALRVVSSMPPWKPAEKDGKPVRVYMQVPFRIWMED
jgi:TonB family protein